MQFSLKWILVAVVYVAVAAAAFSQDSWVYADVLWAASLLAVVYAALIAFLGSGKGRDAAMGFLLASLAYIACVAFGQFSGSDVVPTKRWLMAAGYDPSAVTVYPMAYGASGQSSQSLQWTSSTSAAAYGPPPTTSPGTLGLAGTPVPGAPPSPLVDFGIYVRAANAVGMMLFGALGAMVGLLAFKRISQPAPM